MLIGQFALLAAAVFSGAALANGIVTRLTLILISVAVGPWLERAQAEEQSCRPNQAVYARPDGKEFVVHHVGVFDDRRYLEGVLDGEKVVFVTPPQSSAPGAAGAFAQADDSYERRARYQIKWMESPEGPLDRTLVSKQGPAWEGTWLVVRCDGKSALAAAAIQAAKPLRCPLDRVVFVDEKSGRRFRGERYFEGHSKLATSWMLQGSIEGSEAYLLHEVVRGNLPCCLFYSYYPGERDLRVRLRELRRAKVVPILTEENKGEFAPASADMHVDKYMGISLRSGPLAGMKLVSVECAAQTGRQ